MNHIGSLRWAIIIGGIAGGILPLARAYSDYPLTIPVAFVVMAACNYFSVKYLCRRLDQSDGHMRTKDKMFSGVVLALLSVSIGITAIGLVSGLEFWEWAFVIYLFAWIGCIPIGIFWGLAYGSYLQSSRLEVGFNRVAYACASILAVLFFFVFPIIQWWTSKSFHYY
ncbi:MAG: hypothetical protein WC859_04640 [Elusimicrobiota bacterium]|jgi:hypothetical protein